MSTSSGGANVISGGTALCSSYYSGSYVAAYACDGNAGTAWSSASGQPAWWGYDFGAGNEKGIVEFTWQAHSDTTETPKEILLEYSDDESTWTPVAVFTGIAAWSAGQTRTYTVPTAAADARYWAVYADYHRGQASSRLDVTEIEFREGLGGDQICSGGTAISGSFTEGYEASKAFDANNSTEFIAVSSGTRSDAEWIGYDFGDGNDVTVVEISWKSATAGSLATYYSPVYFLMLYSDDGLSWLIGWVGTFPAWASNSQVQIASSFLALSVFDTCLAEELVTTQVISDVNQEQEGFRFRNDDNNEASATWKADQDANITLAANTAFRLREILNATGDPASIGAQLEYRYKPSGGSFGSWTKVN